MNRLPCINAKIDISLINSAAYLRACSLLGSQQFSLNLADIEVSGHSASTSKLLDLVDLSNVLEEYHEFADVVDKAKAQTLAPHRPYDLKINLEEGNTPPLRQVYSLSQTELKALQEFLDDIRVNKDVVEVYDNTNIDHVCEDVIHE